MIHVAKKIETLPINPANVAVIAKKDKSGSTIRFNMIE